ncbi:MAG: arylsulfatase [Verrucomicrobia bacterium]|jgi:arylsulfatase A-like enzyme|nr:arylsulfatase [Verrucomicrobiota bacterium]
MKRDLLLALLAAWFPAALSAAEPKPSAKPNIVFILADDLGYGDVHCLNPKRGKIATPEIDKLAGQGMTFTDAHSTSAVCTPSRYSILTGRYNWRSHLQSGVLGGMSQPLIARDRLTVAAMLKQNGYATAGVGKWHLGMTMPKPLTQGNIADNPTTRGFDYFFGISASLDMPPYAFIENDAFTEAPTAEKDLYMKRRGPAAPGFEAVDVLPMLTKKATEWIGSHKDGPFFLYLALNSPHTPLNPTPEWRGKSGIGTYGDFVMETDWAIGQVVQAVDRAGVGDNTMILLTSDNGCAPYIGSSTNVDPMPHTQADVRELEALGHFASGDRRGYKSDAWDGGHHVPFIVRWPKTVKAGTTSDRLVCQVDFMATCAAIAGCKIPDGAAEDSFNLLPLLQGGDRPVRETLVHHSIAGRFAIRENKWKLVLCPGSGGWSDPKDAQATKQGLPAVQLYNLADDIAEQRNREASHPEVVKRMTVLLEQIVADGRSTPGPKQKNDRPVDIRKSKSEDVAPKQ